MKIHELHRELWLPRPLSEVFPFFADAGNLELLTPPWMNFHVLTPRPIEMRPGTLIDYRLRVRGLPLRWRSEITTWEPPHRGPYRPGITNTASSRATAARSTTTQREAKAAGAAGDEPDAQGCREFVHMIRFRGYGDTLPRARRT